MSLRKDVKAINEKLDQITSKTIWKAREYDRITEKLSQVKFNVSKCTVFPQDDGSYGVLVTYNIPLVKVFFDGDGEPMRNERFVAMNELNLISIEDQKKILEKIREAEEKNKIGKE